MERLGQFDVVGVIDRRPGRAEALARQRGYRHHATAGSLLDVAWLNEVDAVTIAAPPMAHATLICEALSLGKHVLTEKPFTMTLAEGEQVVEAAARAGRQVGVVHNFQFARSTRLMMKDLAEGALGELTAVNATQLGNPGRRLPEWYDTLPFGLFYDESPHLLYLLRCVAGEIELARAFTTAHRDGHNTPGQIDAFFRTARGVPATLRCNFDSPVSEWHIMVFGTKALAIVDVFRDIYIRLPNDGRHDTKSVLRTSIVATAQHWWQHVVNGVPHLRGRLSYGNEEVFARFAKAAGGGPDAAGALGPIGLDNALAVLRLQHAIIDHAQDGLAP
jgi:predicted dehydrogenase